MASYLQETDTRPTFDIELDMTITGERPMSSNRMPVLTRCISCGRGSAHARHALQSQTPCILVSHLSTDETPSDLCLAASGKCLLTTPCRDAPCKRATCWVPAPSPVQSQTLWRVFWRSLNGEVNRSRRVVDKKESGCKTGIGWTWSPWRSGWWMERMPT